MYGKQSNKREINYFATASKGVQEEKSALGMPCLFMGVSSVTLRFPLLVYKLTNIGSKTEAYGQRAVTLASEGNPLLGAAKSLTR